MAETFFQQIPVPQQKPLKNGDAFPPVLFPNPENEMIPSQLSLFTEAIRAHRPWLDSLLLKSGAILFRGFPVVSASDFNDLVESFGWDELPDVGGGALRTHVVGRVFTANEAPPHQNIPFHHELAYVRNYPSKLFFFCEVPPGCGGETPIVLSHIIYEKMKEKHPQFVEHLEEHGLIYKRVMGETDDLSSPIGRGWKSTFGTEEKSVAEERAAKLGLKLEWIEGGVKVLMGPMPGVKIDDARQLKIWFNAMVVDYAGVDDPRNVDPTKTATFGDGTLLPADVVYDCVKILDEECASIPWQKGDVLLLDNLAVLHARRPVISPPRRVLASLCK